MTSQPMGQPTQTVIHVSGRAQQRYGDQPVSMICPNCGQNVSVLDVKTATTDHLSSTLSTCDCDPPQPKQVILLLFQSPLIFVGYK